MRTKLETALCRLLQIRYPIVLAGMAGGPTTAELVAAVSNAGGLGTLGGAYLDADALRDAIRNIRGKTDKPFAVNLFAAVMRDDNKRTPRMQKILNGFRRELGIAAADGAPLRSADRLAAQLEVLLTENVPVISTAFGVLPDAAMREAKARGMRVIAMVTTVQEACEAEKKGVDIVVAQGSEAGGHRGTFDVARHPMGANIGTMALVPQVVDRVRIPVVAAGGIMDGRGLAASLALGAQGVQMGTRFLTALESGAHPAYQEALLKSTEESSRITKVFSGRPARALANSFMDRLEANGEEPLPFPTQNTATRDIRNAAARQNNPAYMSLWAGQGVRMLTADKGAAEIIRDIVDQATEILG
ncbi:MAG TPA: nitronate monooxygenase [Bacilli bacterium]